MGITLDWVHRHRIQDAEMKEPATPRGDPETNLKARDKRIKWTIDLHP